MHNAEKHGILKGNRKELGWGATKLLIALAFLPENLIEEGYELITKIIFDDNEHLHPFFQYYTETWLHGFQPASFCIYQELHRTNNISERHNRELGESLNKHPRIVLFLGIM